jgi:hypothetical protein
MGVLARSLFRARVNHMLEDIAPNTVRIEELARAG